MERGSLFDCLDLGLSGVPLITTTMDNFLHCNTEIDASKILSTKLDDCQLSNYPLENSSLIDSSEDTFQLALRLKNSSTVTTPSLGLRKLPPGIRELIFKECVLVGACAVRKTPALLVALSGDPGLYHEALKPYYRQNFFRLNCKTSQTVD